MAIYLLYLASFLLVSTLSSASPAGMSQTPSSIWNPLNSSLANLSLAHPANMDRCTSMIGWTVPHFNFDDCKGALQWLYFEEVAQGGGRNRVEFLRAGAKGSKQKKILQPTPRKYTFSKRHLSSRLQVSLHSTASELTYIGGLDTCTIAIVMKNYFHPGELPGEDGTLGADNDISTWKNVYDTARGVFYNCVVAWDSAGWESVGEETSRNSLLCSTCLGTA